MPPKLTLIASEIGDWIGLYSGDRLVIEGHRISEYDMAKALGYEVSREERSQEWFESHGGRCPSRLGDL